MKKLPSSITRKPITFKQIVLLLILATFVLFGTSGYYWYKFVITDPDRVFNDMLSKSMQTDSVFRTVTQQGGGSDVDQSVLMSFSPQVISKSVTKLREANEVGDTTVVTETLGTKDADYVQYTGIDIKGAKKNIDTSSILRTWGKRTSDPKTGETTSFLNDALFEVVPFGNLSSSQRKQILDKIDTINLYEITSSKSEFKDGRPVITYEVGIDPQKLVTVLAAYVEVTGVGNAADLNPTQYEGAAKLPVTMVVDVLSRHLKQVDFKSSGRKELYKSYNPQVEVTVPTKTISTQELQNRLQTLEQ